MFKHAIATGLTALLTLSGAVQAQDNRIDTIRSDAPELAPYGKLEVGVKTLNLVNPGQQDIVKFKAGQPMPTYDRPLTVEVWYPAKLAAGQAPAGQYKVLPRDGKTEVTLVGRAVRDAQPDASTGPYPLLIISHGYPGNRYLLSHLAENLASKGYVVGSIDHMESTYSDQAGFASTLINRPLDILFIMEMMSQLNRGTVPLADAAGFKGMIDVDNTALIGYSMGGYGVINVVGGGFTEASTRLPIAPPNGLLKLRQSGSAEFNATIDQRVKAAVAFAPWGWNAGFWSAESLRGIRTPILYIGGSHDDVSGYSPGFRNLFEASVNAPRYLLTYLNANHNAGAPIPAPAESWARVAHMPTPPAFHYMDPVWDSVKMNNIAQHFVTAFLGLYVKGDSSMKPYLSLGEYASEGKWSVNKEGSANPDHTYWKGFQRRQAAGLRFEAKEP
ncbi:MAG: dienelactone hydrolase [Betaproteobacteria bacterium]|nr:dienelactone hydrolase [Betaproteobacteria bacterium]